MVALLDVSVSLRVQTNAETRQALGLQKKQDFEAFIFTESFCETQRFMNVKAGQSPWGFSKKVFPNPRINEQNFYYLR